MLGLVQVKIQRGTTVSATTHNINIEVISGINSVLAFASARNANTAVTVTIDNLATLKINSNPASIIDWQLIEFGGAV